VPDVIGRRDELAALQALVDSTGFAALVLDGPAGIGKTTLWFEGVRTAEGGGRRVLTSRPASAETRLAFAGLSDLLAPWLDDVLPALPRPQRRALEYALLLRDPDGRAPDERAVCVAFASAIGSLAEHAPLVLAIDDVQWLDEPSASALTFAVARLSPDARVALLLARRSDGEESLPLGLDRSVAAESVRITVDELDPAALSRLLSERFDTLLPPPTLLRVHETCAGNPFYALELTRALLARGDLRPPAGPLPFPATLRELLRDRVAALPAQTAEPLLLLAACGSAPADVLRRALGGDPWQRLRPALAKGIVEHRGDELLFTHPLLSSAVYAAADPDRRRRAHLVYANAADRIEERARHLALATSAPDATTAQALEDAAAQARRRGAGRTVAELLDRAVAFTPDADRAARVRRLAAAAEALNAAADIGRARTLAAEAVEASAPGRERAGALLALAEASYRDVASAEAALAEAGDDHVLRARIELHLAEAAHVHTAPKALAAAERAVAEAELAGEPALEARAYGWLGRLQAISGTGDGLAALARAAALEQPDVDLPVSHSSEFHLATVRLWRDELDEARRLFLDLLHRAEERGDLWYRTDTQLTLGRLEFFAGCWDQSERYFRDAEEVWSASGGQEYANALAWSRAIIPAYRGELERARAMLAAVTGPAPDPGHRARNEWILGHVALCEGRMAEALAALEAAASHMGEAALGVAQLRPFSGDLVEARIAAGKLRDARSEAALLLSLAGPRGTAIGRRELGLVLAAEGELDAALDELLAAAAAHAELPDPYERARTLYALGSLQRRLRRRTHARESLEQAAATFELLGATHWAGLARAELGRIGGRAGADGLTPAERRIAELAAHGSSNKEIAAELVVAVKTVEAALSRVYRKLGVRSRAGLADALAGTLR